MADIGVQVMSAVQNFKHLLGVLLQILRHFMKARNFDFYIVIVADAEVFKAIPEGVPVATIVVRKHKCFFESQVEIIEVFAIGKIDDQNVFRLVTPRIVHGVGSFLRDASLACNRNFDDPVPAIIKWVFKSCAHESRPEAFHTPWFRQQQKGQLRSLLRLYIPAECH